MGVSKNSGLPKWMVYKGKPYQNGWFGGTPIFGNTHIAYLAQKKLCCFTQLSFSGSVKTKLTHAWFKTPSILSTFQWWQKSGTCWYLTEFYFYTSQLVQDSWHQQYYMFAASFFVAPEISPKASMFPWNHGSVFLLVGTVNLFNSGWMPRAMFLKKPRSPFLCPPKKGSTRTPLYHELVVSPKQLQISEVLLSGTIGRKSTRAWYWEQMLRHLCS